MPPRLVIAGTSSGVGKTTVAVGLLAAFRQRGLRVQPFKVGPDYIDPTFHGLAAGRPCPNLDTWMMTPERARLLFDQGCRDIDLAVVEGVMGVFDGAGYTDETGSTAQVAKLLQAPTILLLDGSKMARSGAALATGYARFDSDLALAGFIVNRVGSAAHGAGLAKAIEKAADLPVFGWIPRDDELKVPERHLGLVPAVEGDTWERYAAAAAKAVARHLDLERLLAVARAAPPMEPVKSEVGRRTRNDKWGSAPIIAVARDEAFHFTYEENLELLRAAGAEIAFFSPLRDATLPENAAGVILSGGFPEMFAGALAANTAMHRAIRDAHRRQLPIYAECGGLMYLTETIVDLKRREHTMTGLLPGRSAMGNKPILGYRQMRAAESSWLMNTGESARGHEFHYSAWEGRPADLPPAYLVTTTNGQGEPRPEGACLGSLWASYVHLHFWGKPELADRFVAACLRPGGMFSRPFK